MISLHNIKLLLPVIALCLCACGGSGGGNGLPDPDPSGDQSNIDPGSCAEVIDISRITVPTTLVNTASDCDYLLSRIVTITSDVTIEAGTTILASDNGGVHVDGGSIIAVGSANNRITIRGVEPLAGYWNGISFFESRPSRLEHVDVFDAGKDIHGVEGSIDVSHTAEVSLVDVTIANSYTHGLVLKWRAGITEFSGNRFYGNELAGLAVHFSVIPSLDTETDYYGINNPNGDPVVNVLVGSGMIGELGTVTWPGINAPYRVGLTFIAQDDELTLAPGASFYVDGNDSLSKIGVLSGGKLTLLGTPELPVQLSGPSGADIFPRIEVYNGTLEIEHSQISGLSGGIFAETGAIVRVANTQFDTLNGYAINCDTEDIFTQQIIEIGENVNVLDSDTAVLNPNCPQ